MRVGATSPLDALRPDKSVIEIPVSPSMGYVGSFFYQKSHPRPPSWVADVEKVLTSSVDQVSSASASGVLVLERSGRIFAVSFGYGRSLLEPALVERQF